ncbi:unnamed protein product, partial [Brenthis ino]
MDRKGGEGQPDSEGRGAQDPLRRGGSRRVNPARISAADETKIARRRVQLHTARQCRRAGTRSLARRGPPRAGKFTLCVLAERATSPICGAAGRRATADGALAPHLPPRTSRVVLFLDSSVPLYTR